MRKIVLTALIAVFGGFYSFAYDAESLYQNGVEAYKQGEYLKALNCYSEAYGLCPYDGKTPLSFDITAQYVYILGEVGDFAKMMSICNDAIDTAKRVGDSTGSTIFSFYKAMALYDLGSKEEAHKVMDKTYTLLDTVVDVTPDIVMVACNSMVLSFNEGDYAEAVERGRNALLLIDKAKEEVDLQVKARVYGILAAAHAYQGDMKSARQSEADYWASNLSEEDPSEGCDDLLNYYLASRNFPLAEKVLARRLAWLDEYPDSLNTYTVNTLNHYSSLYYDQGRYKDAYAMQERAMNLQQMINEKTIRDRILDLEVEFNTLEQTRQKQEAEVKNLEMQHKLHVSNMVLVLILLLVVGLVIVFIIKHRSVSKIKAKNLALTELIHKLHEQRQTLQTHLEEHPAPASSDEEEQAAFMRLEKMMDEEKLFLDPNVGRDRIVERLGVSKNVLPTIIKKYSSDSSLPTYLNRKRVEHAVKLMREHPDWQMKAIVLSSGFSNNASFYRAFNAQTGMTPGEYLQARDSIEDQGTLSDD